MKIQMMLLREVPYVNSLSTNRRAARQKRCIKTSTVATDGAMRWMVARRGRGDSAISCQPLPPTRVALRSWQRPAFNLCGACRSCRECRSQARPRREDRHARARDVVPRRWSASAPMARPEPAENILLIETSTAGTLRGRRR